MTPINTRTFPPDHDGTAILTPDGRAAIRFERSLRHPIDRVWAVLRFELQPANSGTTLVFSDTRPVGSRAQNSVLAGWHLRMDQLPEHLDGCATDWLALDRDRDEHGHVAAIAEIYWHYRNQPRSA